MGIGPPVLMKCVPIWAFTSVSENYKPVLVLQDTDLVPSDIAAGLVLLHQEQDKVERSRDPEIVIDHSPSSPMVSADKKPLQHLVNQEKMKENRQSHFRKFLADSAF